MDVLRVKERRVMQETAPAHASAVAQFAQKHQCLTLTTTTQLNKRCSQTASPAGLLHICIRNVSPDGSHSLHLRIFLGTVDQKSEILLNLFKLSPTKLPLLKNSLIMLRKSLQQLTDYPYSRWLILLISCCNSCKYNPQILCPSEEICKFYKNQHVKNLLWILLSLFILKLQ